MPEAGETTYKDAGVDIDAASEAVSRIAAHARRTRRPEVLADVGPFSGMYALKTPGVLVASADGVGTKLKVAFMMQVHDTVGIDCVAMNVNDILTAKAEPLFFLDYIGTGKVKPHVIEAIVKGVAEGCVRSGCALLGGETAELPGMYKPGEYDLAGFAVGLALGGAEEPVRPGDLVLGVASSGLHSNGYSLARKVFFEMAGLTVESYVPDLGRTLGEELLEPTRIYSRSVLAALRGGLALRSMAHVTGGGFFENVPRALPPGVKAVIREGAWPVPPVFTLLERLGNVGRDEMYRTFNMGIGMVLVAGEEDAPAIAGLMESLGEKVYEIGRIEAAPGRSAVELK